MRDIEKIKDSLIQELGIKNLEKMPRDASPRHYYRGTWNDKKSIVMVYPENTQETQRELDDFIKIGDWLAKQGVRIPQFYTRSKHKCCAIFEDLGTQTFRRTMTQAPEKTQDYYRLATKTLIKIKDAKNPDFLNNFKQTKVYARRRQFAEYYIAYNRREKTSPVLTQSYMDVLEKIEQGLAPIAQIFTHADYHLENLIYTKDGQCALIDYQDAFLCPQPYDLMNLLMDARNDVPQNIQKEMIDLYCEEMDEQKKQNFMNWYTVLAAQFHGRVLGLFIRLAAEQNRDSYLIHIPRLQNYMQAHLNHPIMQPLKSWFEKEGVDFTPLNDLDGNHIREVFQNISY